MATESIIPVQVELTSGTYYTLWAPSWRENGEEWQAFLGAGDSLYFFTSPAHLLAFLNSGDKHDFTAHPRWSNFEQKTAEGKAVPAARHTYDLIGVPADLAEKPSYASVSKVQKNFAFARSLGRVCGLDAVNSFFDNHSLLENLNRGADHYAGDEGLAEWSAVGRTILSNWGRILDEFEYKADEEGSEEKDRASVFIIPTIGGSTGEDTAVSKAQQAIDESTRAREEREAEEAAAAQKNRDEKAAEEDTEEKDPYDSTIWASSGIDPIKIVINGKTVYTLRCYLGESPVFLGKFGAINTFPTGRALARWIADNNDHDLAKLATWGELVDKATVGELKVDVHETNNYVFTNLAESIEKGPKEVDTHQLGQAYEVIADAADWAGDDAVNSVLLAVPELQEYISYMLGTTSSYVPSAPYSTETQGWKQLEETLTSRFSKF